jgi:TatD DNase family protein
MPPSKSTIVDSHAHLGWESFAEDRDQVIQRAFESGVAQIVQAGVYLNESTMAEMVAIADAYDNIYGAVGLHPHEAKAWTDGSSDVIRHFTGHPKVVAIGECGLDYHYNHSEPATQRQVFAEQVKLARQLSVPLILHTREAWDDTFEILETVGEGKVWGVFHCFTGSPDVLPRIREIDFYVSFSGIVTFPKSTDIQAAAKAVDESRLMVETDCPYLAPHGYRGKRNEPAYVWKVAEKLAELRGQNLDEIATLTSNNARALFGLPEPQPP